MWSLETIIEINEKSTELSSNNKSPKDSYKECRIKQGTVFGDYNTKEKVIDIKDCK